MSESTPDPQIAAPQTVFDYHRTVIAYHGTRMSTARSLVAGREFEASTNDDDWLGHGIYFWEYAPQQAWWWARQRYGADAAVVGAIIRLGQCFDLFDPANAELLAEAYASLCRTLREINQPIPNNANKFKYLDCAVFNYLYSRLEEAGFSVDCTRAVFVPMIGGRLPRLWSRSAVFRGGHIQLCVREPRNIIAVWSVRRDGRYGEETQSTT